MTEGGGGGIPPPQLRLGWNTSSPDPIGWVGCSRHTNRTGATRQTTANRIQAHVPEDGDPVEKGGIHGPGITVQDDDDSVQMCDS